MPCWHFGSIFRCKSEKLLAASETENIEQVIIEQSNFKSPENVWIQMFHRGSLSVLLKSKKLFGEGDVGYAMWVMEKS